MSVIFTLQHVCASGVVYKGDTFKSFSAIRGSKTLEPIEYKFISS